MSNAAPLVLISSPWGPVDPASLPIRWEICRLQAELGSLEARIVELGSSTDTGIESQAPFVDRAEELVERMVASLRQAGREEIDAASDRRRAEAQGQLDEARHRAELVLERARADLAAALAERERAVGTALGGGLEDLALVDDDPAVAAVPVPAVVPVVEPVASVVEPASPSAADVEEARTDAAFDLWMAVAPPAPAAEPEAPAAEAATAPAVAPVADGGERARSRWLLPLEVAAALLAAVMVVVLVLVLVG